VQEVLPALRNGPVKVKAGLFRVMDTPVLLVRVILLVALVTPTAVVLNVTVLGLKDTLLVPVPETPTSCGEVGSVSLMITVPFFKPVLSGVKVKLMVQLAPPLSLLPAAGHVLDVMVKSVVSFNVMPFMVIAVAPVFFTVTVCTALVVFTSWLPKLRGAPVTEMAVATPDRAMLELALKKPFVVTVTEPAALPDPVGTK
jgi:hypothetical protein